LLKLERIKDYLLLEDEYIKKQKQINAKTNEEKDQGERLQLEDLRGTPITVGTMEEIIDDEHAVVSTTGGPEYYVNIMSFVDKDSLEPGCTVLLHQKVREDTLTKDSFDRWSAAGRC
jgi:26S proteasome regulatory subunit T2